MNEDKKLKQIYGKNNPFTVPEGYFDKIADDIMKQIPDAPIEQLPQISLWGKIRPWVYMAAMFVGMTFTIRIFMSKFNAEKTQESNKAIPTCNVSEIPDEYVDPIVNQAMMADYQLYEYLSDATTTANN